MALSAAVLRKMVEMGLTLEQAAELAEAWEAAPAAEGDNAASRKRARDAARMREKREAERLSRDVAATVAGDTCDTEQKSSPGPPKKTTPPSPPKGGSSPTATESDPSPSLDDLVEQIWSLQPKRYRRSTRPDVRTALEPQLRKHPFAEVFAACRAYYALPDSQKSDGEFAMGAAKLLKAGRWRDFAPRPEPPAGPVSEVEAARRLRHYRDTGEWKEAWGPRPQRSAA